MISVSLDEDPSSLSKPEDSLIILLSDGHGELEGSILLNNVDKKNRNTYVIYSLRTYLMYLNIGVSNFSTTIHTISFGNNADDILLETVASHNLGRWKKILSDLDSALQV